MRTKPKPRSSGRSARSATDPLEVAPEALQQLHRIAREAIRTYLSPPPRLTISEWADRYRELSREAAAEPGRWRTERAPYQRGIMDAFADPAIETVVVMSSSQVGKTEVLMNVLGYFVAQDPSPLLIVRPTIGEATQWSKTRLAPMIRDSPALAELVQTPRSRDSGNTLLVKEFPGGHLTIVGANAPSGLAAKPIRVVLCDEVDRFPASAGSEGDPIALAVRRTQTFWNRKIALVSSPTVKGLSRIEQAYQQGDQRRYVVPCPACHFEQALTWANLRWEPERPETASYECTSCHTRIRESQRSAMLRGGHWQPTAAGDGFTASFHLNALYSPWARWAELVRDWLAAQDSVERLQSFVNTVLGETWEERGGGFELSTLEERREAYQGIPAGVGLLTMGVDVQVDRLEYVIRGWGAAEESWLIAHEVILGDPGTGTPWEDLERARAREWPTMGKKPLRIAVCCIDSGYQTDAVYAYCRPRFGQRVYAVKGSSIGGRPIVPRRPSTNNRGRVRLFELGTEAAKDVIYSRLRIAIPGPQYLHIPTWAHAEYLEQLTAERAVRRQIAGRWIRRYELARGKRSEALDCEVYALAALRLAPIRAGDLAKLAAEYGPPGEGGETPAPTKPERPRGPRGSWLHGWRS